MTCPATPTVPNPVPDLIPDPVPDPARGPDCPPIPCPVLPYRDGTRTPIQDLDLENIKNWKLYNVDLQAAWGFAKHGFAGTLENVRLTDEAVFAFTIFMPPSMRAKYFRYDFDSRGDIREYRIPRDPPMVIQCHGINWFPVYRSTTILCGTWRFACSWLRGTVVSPSYGFSIGEFVAPPEAATACSAPLQLNGHHLRPSLSGVSPDKLLLSHFPPTSLDDAISRQGIFVNMDITIPHIIVIDSKETSGFQTLTEIEGFHYLAGPNSDPKDCSQCIHKHMSSKDNLKEKYGGPYKNITVMKPLKNRMKWEPKPKPCEHRK
ncbi:hypothetical protein PENSUB_10932 [Penicillium subrubescens]|uniref:Uncharacterized protein n=2 Tax=Penicillium subrubescens TaxID=1316194 RepID=A0A1Q5T6Q3_9EURO|nr:hypothetical protein PENSUB_10932 [Penicillium subrubescens]